MAVLQDGLFSNVEKEGEKLLGTLKNINKETLELEKQWQSMPEDFRKAAEALEKLRIIPDKRLAVTTYKPLVQTLQQLTEEYSNIYDASKGYETVLRANRSEIKEGIDGVEDFIGVLGDQKVAIDQTIKKYKQQGDAASKSGEAADKVRKRSKKIVTEERKAIDDLTDSLKKSHETLQKISGMLADGHSIRVHIDNQGFTRVLDEMSNAVDRFHERAEGAQPRKKNFFDQLLGTRQENRKSSDDLVSEAKNTINQVKTEFLEPLGKNITDKISVAISKGIRSGVITGINELSNLNPITNSLAGIAEGLNLSQTQKRRIMLAIAGKVDETEIQKEAERGKWDLDARKYEAREKRKTAERTAVSKRLAELDWNYNNFPEETRRKKEAEATLAVNRALKSELALKRALAAEEQRNKVQQFSEKEKKRIHEELSKVYGEEGSKVQKLGEEFVRLQAKQRQYVMQENVLGKINFAEQANNMRRIVDTTRKWAAEMWKVRHHTDRFQNFFKAAQTALTRIASLTQTLSAGISAASGLWSNMRSAATSFFRYFTNGFRRAFSYVRNLATSTLQAGIEQRKKIEQAQIGFASFFGEDRVDAVTSRIRQEAMKTPIVDAGSLADYVQQLAPVSQGNASLAINASLGILKSLVYSGSDISEGEYVIKNIRDVIAKGKATAIDIRQFNRALPGLEQALRESGNDAFIDKEGKLNITSKNVGKVLDMFARLNTEENSPLRNIEEKQLQTLEGLQQLFNEKKTTAMETILRKSGFFDLMYQTFGIANDQGKWDKITNFLSDTLKPVVQGISNFVSGVNWDDLGNKLKTFFGIVWEGVKEAKDLIFGALGNAFGGDADGLIRGAATTIKSFIIGFGKGVKDVIDFVSDIIKRLSKMFAGGDINKFVEMVGRYLVSPLGKLIQMMFSLSQNGIGALSRISAFLASAMKGAGDATKWIANVRSLSFANGIVSSNKAKLTDLTVEQMQALLQGKTIPGIKNATTATNTFGAKVKAATASVGSFILKIASAFAVGGTIYLISQGLGETVKALGLFGDNTNTVARIIKAAGTTIAGVVTGYMIGGIAGGLVGALLAAGLAAKQFRDDLRNEQKEKDEERLKVVLNETQEKLSNGIIKNMKDSGLDIDTGTDAGYYAKKKMDQYIAQYDDPGMVDLAEAEKVFLDALRFKQTMEDMYDFTNSEEFNKMGGNVIDLQKDAGRRDKVAEIIKYFRLNGDNYDYENTSAESIVKDWLNGDKLTDKQADAIISKFGGLYGEFGGSVETMAGKIDNASDTMEEVMRSIDANTTEMDRLRSEIAYLGKDQNIFEGIAKDMLNYEGIASKGTYTADGKTYGVADLWRFVNDKIAEVQTDTSLTSEERDAKLREWALLNRDIMDDYANNPDFDAGKWFRYMMQKYGTQGFRQYYNENGVEGDVNAYMDRIRETGGTYFKDQYNWFYRFIQGHPNTGLRVGENSDVENGIKWDSIWLLSEEDRKKLQDYTRDRAQSLIEEFWNNREKEVQEENKRIQEREANRRKNASTQWWNPFTWFSNHGGITPIYRATGGLGVDTVPAMLQPGEFVMRRSAVAKAGLGTMYALNRGDMVAAARSLGARFNQSNNNSRNWSNVVNNNQKSQTNYVQVINKNKSGRVGSYYSLVNRIALA